MIINSFDRFDLVNAIKSSKPAFTIWFSGCDHKCEGCYNKQLWDYNNGKSYTPDEIIFAIETNEFQPEDIVLLGGEPLDQQMNEMIYLCNRLYHMGYKIWLYTGYEIQNNRNIEELMPYLHFVKTGKFINDGSGHIFASSNQKALIRINDNMEDFNYENNNITTSRI